MLLEENADSPSAVAPDRLDVGERLGCWAFRQRSWLPLPLILVLVLVHRWQTHTPLVWIAGAVFVAAGLALRLWSVRHIGSISRTRANRLGPLLTSGPYAIVRNPLYVANWWMWTGFVVMSGLLWMLPIAWAVFGAEYGAIVHWEERALAREHGLAYRTYLNAVPRWVPVRPPVRVRSAAAHPWSAVFFSERGTLLAAGAIAAVLALKHWFAAD
jgi:protein-S-isoprenylcysteine O-methyltransferase Ste14